MNAPRSGVVRRCAGAVVALALIGAACGDDDDAAGDPAAFCEQFEAAEPAQGEADAATYEALAAVAPGDLRADLERIAAWFEELEALDEDEAVEAAIALVADPEYQATVQRVERFLVDECGIDPADLTEVGPGAIDTPTFEFDDDGGVPFEVWEAALAEQFGDRVMGAGRVAGDDRFELDANIADLTGEEALAACAELSSVLAEHPDAAGETSLLLTDHSFDRSPVELARNARITLGDPGTCEAV